MKMLTTGLFLLSGTVLFAQDNYEIQVYSAPTMTRGVTMFELHSNYTVNGEKNDVKGIRPTWHSLHETLEITQGITDNFELGFYLFTNYTNPYGYRVIGTHLRPRVCAPDSWHLPVGLSLSAEIGFQSQSYSQDTWSVECRPIIDKTIGKVYVSLNPVLSFSLAGANIQPTPAFTPNVKVSVAASPVISLGAEYYGDVGAVTHFDPGPQQSHAVFAVADLDVDPRWEINFGPGWGLTSPTDGLVLKLILGRRIQWKKQPPKTRSPIINNG